MGVPNTTPFGTGLFGGPLAQTGPVIFVSDLLYSAMRIAGILSAPGRGYSASDAEDGLMVLNSMLDTWTAERLTVYAELRSIFNLIANRQFYVIGQSGVVDWNVPRPERIERAGYIFTNVTPNVEVPARILTDQEWSGLSPHELTSTIPTTLYYQALVPNGQVTVWPIPTDVSQVGQVAIYTWQQIPQFPSTITQCFLPPAYRNAIEYNLAIEMAVRYQRRANLTPLAVQIAASSKRKLKAMNSQVLLMQTEMANRGGASPQGRYNPLSNSYNP